MIVVIVGPGRTKYERKMLDMKKMIISLADFIFS